MKFVGSFIPPKLSTVDRNAITTPKEGEIIYNTTTNTNNYYNGFSWIEVGTGTGGGASLADIYAVQTLQNC